MYIDIKIVELVTCTAGGAAGVGQLGPAVLHHHPVHSRRGLRELGQRQGGVVPVDTEIMLGNTLGGQGLLLPDPGGSLQRTPVLGLGVEEGVQQHVPGAQPLLRSLHQQLGDEVLCIV